MRAAFVCAHVLVCVCVCVHAQWVSATGDAMMMPHRERKYVCGKMLIERRRDEARARYENALH